MNNRRFDKQWICVVFSIVVLYWVGGCGGHDVKPGRTVRAKYTYIEPSYDSVTIVPVQDTLHFPLEGDFYNQIRNVNYFDVDGVGFLAMFDGRSKSLCIYDFKTRSVVRRFYINRVIGKDDMYMTCLYVKNFDTIVIANKSSVLVVDTAGEVKFKRALPEGSNALLDIVNPPLFKGDNLIVSQVMRVSERDLKAVSNWSLLLDIGILNGQVEKKYAYPEYYVEDYYGTRMMRYFTCVNSADNVVVSFAGDSTLYETDVEGQNNSYYARSRFQEGAITPMTKELIEQDKGSREFRMRHAYGPIYFDKLRDRYLRVAKLGMSDSDYESAGRRRRQSILVLDNRFKVIGEQTLDSTLYTDCMFFDHLGNLYSRYHASDDYTVHFIRLTYSNEPDLNKMVKNER